MPRPALPYATVRLASVPHIGMDEVLPSDATRYTAGQREAVLEVNVYGGDAMGIVLGAREAVRLRANYAGAVDPRFAIRRATSPLNLTALVDGVWEARALVEFSVGYGATQDDGVATVEAERIRLEAEIVDRGDEIPADIEVTG